MRNWIIIILVSILLVSLQVSFINEFYFLRGYVNAILILVVLSATVISYRVGISIALISGILQDIYQPFGFGASTISLVLTVFVIYYLLRKLFARKSLYSLIASSALGTIAYSGFMLLIEAVRYIIGDAPMQFSFSVRYLTIVGIQIIANTVIAIGLYGITKIILKKLRSTFIISDRV